MVDANTCDNISEVSGFGCRVSGFRSQHCRWTEKRPVWS